MANQKLGQAIVDALLLSSPDGRRFLQNSPILPDVWLHYAVEPHQPLDLLITPHFSSPAGAIAVELGRAIRDAAPVGPDIYRGTHEIAYLRSFVVAKLDFDELITHVLPRTSWWRDLLKKALFDGAQPRPGAEDKKQKRTDQAEQPPLTLEQLVAMLPDLIREHLEFVRIGADQLSAVTGAQELGPMRDVRKAITDQACKFAESVIRLARFLALLGAVAVKGQHAGDVAKIEADDKAKPIELLARFLDGRIGAIVEIAVSRFTGLAAEALQRADAVARGEREQRLIYNVSHNRRAATALDKSVPAIKGDAARALFNISAREIGWAVLDTGIDARHEAFLDWNAASEADRAKSRVVESYDFTRVRQLLRVEYLFDDASCQEAADEIAARLNDHNTDFRKILLELAEAAERGAQIDWARVAPLIRLDPKTPPAHPHGTHVAGIIGADWRYSQDRPKMTGVCPDIRLYDLRVIAGGVEETEFAVIAALQFVRARNENFMKIHGVNMSLSIPHNVRNYACGRTPVCEEAQQVIDSGVVVVAAAGNRGYQQFQLASGDVFENYSSSSITDPGNADGVITVGATHRFWPHTYGVSFFSSRGPTGDGRIKPDIVAPGEKIESTVPNNGVEAMDGTSMAAPHVSGAAALLLARYSELIKQPALVKDILCRNATDLQRERSFQGHGMLDVLRALQDR